MSKKKVFIFVGIFVLLVILAAIFNDSLAKKADETRDLTNLEPVKITKGKLNIMVDPRIELLASVQLNSGYFRLTKLDFNYKRNMEKYFNKFKNHEAVNMFTELSRKGFTYHVPPTLMLHLTNPPELKKVIPYMDSIRDRGLNDYQMDLFVSKLQKYSVDTDFQKFYNNNMGFYNTLVKKVSEDIKDFDIVNDLEEYFGIKMNSYNIILAPLFHPGGYASQIERDDGTLDIYAFIGPMNVENGLPVFSKDIIRSLVWHEFGHSFVNPITSKYASEIDKYSKLYWPISWYMQSQSYGDWMSCVNEHIVRAVTTRLSYIKLGKELGDRALRYEKNRGFFYIEPLLEKLKIYEENRDKYPTFEDFYPELIEVFKELSQKNLGEDFYSLKFEGSIDFAFWGKYKKVFIVPTNEKNDLIESKILNYVKVIKNVFNKDAEILTDTEALNRDLSDYNIIAYGTIDGNLWLSKYKSEYPFKIESGRIIADTEYSGEHLRFISALPNPQNHDRALIIYTALKAEDVLNINEIFHGPTDYVIADGKKVLKSGDYIKNDGKWTFK